MYTKETSPGDKAKASVSGLEVRAPESRGGGTFAELSATSPRECSNKVCVREAVLGRVGVCP